VEDARSHYPSSYSSDSPVYRNALKTYASESSSPQTFKHPLAFDYRIAYQLTRLHYNPPIWLDSHPHRFSVELTLRAVCRSNDLYGLDMVEVQRILTHFAESLPEVINDSPHIPLGTTEQLCLYFFGLKALLDPHITIVSVSVSEECGRVTSLSASELSLKRHPVPLLFSRCVNFFSSVLDHLKDVFRLASNLLALSHSTWWHN
jgi:6-pyruvoyl-tetrahydropterin synthase